MRGKKNSVQNSEVVLQYCKTTGEDTLYMFAPDNSTQSPSGLSAMYNADQLSIEITVLQEISQAIVHEKNAHALLDKVLAILDNRMHMLHGTFTMLRGDVFKIEASLDISAEGRNRAQYHIGEGITGHVAETGRPHVIPDVSKDKRFLNLTGKKWGAKKVAFICVPIFYNERVIGTLSVDRVISADVDLEHDLKFLEIIGNISAEAVAVSLQEHEERRSLMEENRKLKDMLGGHAGKIIGNSSNIRHVYELVHQVAASDATVLIRGGSGTGKELVARAIFELSNRSAKPFVILNCAALPETLVESELFGYEKGAFTGATQKRIGRAEAADGGTLFLDEIGDLSLSAQVKLLRFLQERTFSRLGSSRELKADVRFLAATSRNLEELIEQGKFREDLYYRLNIFPIQLPDLNERKGDIVLLAEHFIEKYNLKYGKAVNRISSPAINMLIGYHWPGNVRELENCMERAVLTAGDNSIHSYNLPPSLQTGASSQSGLLPANSANLATMLDSYERELLVEALKNNMGNMSAAARELGISPRVMHYKVNRLGIVPLLYLVPH